jgi:hypothetical protein
MVMNCNTSKVISSNETYGYIDYMDYKINVTNESLTDEKLGLKQLPFDYPIILQNEGGQ